MANYLIVAGTSTIGVQTVKRLQQLGHQVVITGRSEEKTKYVATELGVDYFLLEASDFNQVDVTLEKIIKKLGSLQGIVNCAGSFILKSAHMTNSIDYENTINANLTTAFAICAAAGKHLSKTGGSIVLLSSASAITGIAHHEAIAAAKAGIIGLAQSAAATYAANNLRFNVVAPGLIETALTKELTDDPLNRKASILMHPLGTIGQPNDVAEAIIFFLNPDNHWITGQVLAVDGGMSHVRPKIKM